jgi:hypothetical protein
MGRQGGAVTSDMGGGEEKQSVFSAQLDSRPGWFIFIPPTLPTALPTAADNIGAAH